MSTGAKIWDAIVVGSGPAGATAALQLARAGLQVLILEKQAWPRYKTCGGGLVGRGRRLLDVAIEEAVEMETYRAELHQRDTGSAFAVTRDRPLVGMAMRSRFDALLTSAARDAGAALTTECALTGIERQADRLVVGAGDRDFYTRYLVAADGASGPTAVLAGWAPNPSLIPAIESEIRVDPSTHERFASSARFDFGVVPSGYAWVFPKRDGLSVGCLSCERQKPDLKRHLTAYLRGLEIHPQEMESHGFVIPVAPRARGLARQRVLLTGDAAGLADPVTCEGISHAILSARLAAAAITNHHSDPDAAALHYQRSLEHSLLPELRSARLLARFLYRTPRFRRFVFRRIGQPLAEAMVDIIAGDLTYRRLLASPFRYLRAAKGLMRNTTTYPNG